MEYVVYARPNSKNFIFSVTDGGNNNILDTFFQEKKINFNKYEEMLMICTPFYREAISLDINPIKLFPELKLVENPNFYQRPKYYLFISPKITKNIKFFYLNSIVQNGIRLPPWEVAINPTEFANQTTDNFCTFIK